MTGKRIMGAQVVRKLLTLAILAMLAGSMSARAAEGDVSEAAPENDPNAPKALSGMSILGNSEAPKSLVIVPWKTSEIGDGIGVTNLLDGRARPVDRDVFMRELDYYQLRTGAPQDDS